VGFLSFLTTYQIATIVIERIQFSLGRINGNIKSIFCLSTRKERGVNFEMSWLKAMREKEPPEPVNPIGTVVIGTIYPDIMDAAKDMVRKSLKAAQFKTVDVGRGVSPAAFASKAKETNADIIVVSILLSAAKEHLPKLISAIEQEGLRDKIVIMIGGAAVDKADADKIGALFGKTREEAVVLAKKAMEQKRNNT
jgi:methylmalonyl-CoA mutase cobalamin-binding domain/chain